MLSWTTLSAELVSSTAVVIAVFLLGFTFFKFKFIIKSLLFGFRHVVAVAVTDDHHQTGDIPKGTMGWPFIGETLAYLQPHNSNSIGNFLQQRCSKYGKVFKSHLFGSPTIVSCDFELNVFILQNEERYFRVFYPKPVKDIVGNLSMIIVTGEQHKKLRNAAVNFITASKNSLDFLHYVDKLVITLTDPWKHQKYVTFTHHAKQFTFFVMVKNLLDVEPNDPLTSKLLEDFMTFMKGFVSIPIYFPGTPYAKAMKARTRISSTLNEIIKERKQKYEMGNINCNKGNFLEEIMMKEELNEAEIGNVVLDLLLAGYETTSGLFALLVYFLARSPTTLHQLKEEHLAIRSQKKNGELLNLEDYKKMVFTANVISETLRLGNLVKFVHRKAIKEVRFKGIVIPEGWQVLPVMLATHLDPSLHENPSHFDPWRWNDKATNKKVTPFGGGLRLCPGAELARVEAAFFLHHFVLNFRWKIKEDECPILYPYLEFKKGLVLELMDPNDEHLSI